MSQPLIQPTTAAVTTQTQIPACNQSVFVHADNLATTETVPILFRSGATWKALTDSAGNVQKLTATIPVLTLVGGLVYAVTKDATAGSCGVYYDMVARSY